MSLPGNNMKETELMAIKCVKYYNTECYRTYRGAKN